MKTAIFALAAAAVVAAEAATAGETLPKQEDFKVTLTGVAVQCADDEEEAAPPKPVDPSARVVVPPGKLALFYLSYDFPTNVQSRLFLGPNFKEAVLVENPFGTSGSGLVSGKGRCAKVVILGAGGAEPYEKPLLLKSVRITGEIEAGEDAPRNDSFFIRDFPVNVLYANDPASDGSDAVALEPEPAPKPDPTLGVVPAEKAKAKMSSTPEGFTDDLDEAFSKAKAEGKLVYACFSGSDWCGWCKALEREVLSKKAFTDAVKDDFVLVFIDSPSNKKLLSERARAENPKLVKKYKIEGFPTALVFDGDGKKLGETGYRPGGPEAYAKHLKEFNAKKD